jgi:hypothetical protein
MWLAFYIVIAVLFVVPATVEIARFLTTPSNPDGEDFLVASLMAFVFAFAWPLFLSVFLISRLARGYYRLGLRSKND